MSFADAMREDGRFTRTENGAVALNTSGDARLDLFGTIGSLREADENRITTLFAEAYAQDKLFATKIAFYARDIRGGLGAGRWDEIKYPEVPSRAMMIYRKAFMKHDAERFGEFISKAENGEVKINASTLFPYDIVEKILYDRESNKVLEAQWKALPDYVEKGTNALVMADVSGSMRGRPMATSIGLAIYFAERNVGAYHNLFMTFSDRPETVILRGETLEQKIRNVSRANWDNNTDLKAAFERVLEIAKKHNTPQEEMPKAIVVISDMEIDYCGNREWSFYDKMANKFRKAGYVIPNIIFWNVNSRQDVFHADHNRKGVQLASGQSVTVFKQILQNLGYNPVEAMENTINSERYDCITVE